MKNSAEVVSQGIEYLRHTRLDFSGSKNLFSQILNEGKVELELETQALTIQYALTLTMQRRSSCFAVLACPCYLCVLLCITIIYAKSLRAYLPTPPPTGRYNEVSLPPHSDLIIQRDVHNLIHPEAACALRLLSDSEGLPADSRAYYVSSKNIFQVEVDMCFFRHVKYLTLTVDCPRLATFLRTLPQSLRQPWSWAGTKQRVVPCFREIRLLS